MKKTLTILGIACLGLAACQQFKNTEGGLLYKIHNDQPTPNIKYGDFVAFKFIQKTEGDSIMYNSFDFEQSTAMYADTAQFKGDFNSGLFLLSEGDSATVKVSMDSLRSYAKKKLMEPPTIKGNYLIYILKVVKVIPKGTDSIGLQTKIREFFVAESEKAKNNETARVNNYIAAKSLKPTVTASGLNYVINKQGTGATAAVGDSVLFNYTVSLLSGTIFDTSLPELSKKAANYDPSRPYEPTTAAAGMHEMIAGFDEALLLFPVGTKATIILPSKLAYAEQGRPVPPFTPLVADLEILKISKPKPGAQPPSSLPPAQ